MNEYQLIAQQDKWGCGVACVASLLAVPYEVAKQRLVEYKGRGINQFPKGLELDPIVKVLHDAGVEVLADWFAQEFPDGTIVYIEGGEPYECGHYLLRVSGGWMDPWFNMPEEDRVAKVRKGLPKGAIIKVALIPK